MQKANQRPRKSRDEVKLPKLSLFHSQKFKVVLPSALVGIVMIVSSLYYSGLSGNTSIRDVGVIFGALTAIVPVTLIHLRETQRKDNIDRNLPLFLLALSSAVQSGANLIRAIENAADRNMGPLTPELKNLRANISWGMPIEDAFENFANKTGTKMSKRVAVLLEMALKIGGDIRTNLEMIQKHVTELQNLEKERKSSLAPYTYTIYISFAVFLGIAVILSSQFFSEFAVVQKLLEKSPGEGEFFSSITNMDIEALNTVLFNMSIIEAIFGGLAAGKIGSGNYVAGIKHIIVMIVMAVVAFMFI
ncbi:MAG: type II secretion system F domain-containing protein [Thaumarchaeota archaeon CSP1-1]|nr:MAG: type II secretion system F domain-containing protein [Thaumarchaeota archaeon CSP1-1]